MARCLAPCSPGENRNRSRKHTNSLWSSSRFLKVPMTSPMMRAIVYDTSSCLMSSAWNAVPLEGTNLPDCRIRLRYTIKRIKCSIHEPFTQRRRSSLGIVCMLHEHTSMQNGLHLTLGYDRITSPYYSKELSDHHSSWRLSSGRDPPPLLGRFCTRGGGRLEQ